MTKEQIDALVRGATLYHRLAEGSPQGEGVAVFLFGENGRAAVRLPTGRVMAGDFTTEHGGYVINWDGGPRGSGSTLTKEGGRLICRNAADGAVRSTIEKLVFGDPEHLGEDRGKGRAPGHPANRVRLEDQ